MLDLAKSTLIDTRIIEAASTVIALEEGTALVYAMENGQAVVKPSAGTSGEVFAGVSQTKHSIPTQHNLVVEGVVPASGPYTVTLAKTPISAGNVTVYLAGVKATQGAVADNVYSVTGNVLTFHSADAGVAYKVIYKVALTQAEANLIYGGDAIGANLMDDVGVTVISTGIVFTDKFLITDSWESAVGPVYLGANGLFSLTAGTGTLLDAIVVSVPSVSNGFLGLALKP